MSTKNSRLYERTRGGGFRHIATGFVHSSNEYVKGEGIMGMTRFRFGNTIPQKEGKEPEPEPTKKIGGSKIDGAGVKPRAPRKKKDEKKEEKIDGASIPKMNPAAELPHGKPPLQILKQKDRGNGLMLPGSM